MKILIDPKVIPNLTKEELVKTYALTCSEAEEFDAQKKAIRDLLLDKIKGSGEVIGNYAVTKAKRINFSVSLDQARELGAVKEAVDNPILKKLHGQGADIPHTVSEYVLVKEIQE